MGEVSNSQEQVRPSNVYKAVGILLTITVIVIMGWLFLGESLEGEHRTGQPPRDQSSTQQPDRAKQQTGNTGDTTPSANGTGPGSSNNSILGQ